MKPYSRSSGPLPVSPASAEAAAPGMSVADALRLDFPLRRELRRLSGFSLFVELAAPLVDLAPDDGPASRVPRLDESRLELVPGTGRPSAPCDPDSLAAWANAASTLDSLPLAAPPVGALVLARSAAAVIAVILGRR